MTKRDEAGDAVLLYAVSNFLPNLRFFGVGWMAVFILGWRLRFVAIVGIAAFSLLFLWSFVRLLIALVLGVWLLFHGTSATVQGTEAKHWIAKALLFAETLVYAVFVWVLYLAFFA